MFLLFPIQGWPQELWLVRRFIDVAKPYRSQGGSNSRPCGWRPHALTNWAMEASAAGRRCFAWLADIDAAFAWQARCLWHWAGSSGVLGRVWRRGLLHGRRGSGWHWCGRRGTSWHRRAFCVAGVALMASSGTGLGVALGDIDGRFAWRAWRLVTLTYLLCGRCGAWWH